LTNSVTFGGDYSYSLSHLIPNFVGNFLGYFGLFIFGEGFLPIYTKGRDLLRGEALYILAFLAAAIVILGIIIFVNKKKVEKMLKTEYTKYVLFSILFSFISLIPFLGLGNITERYSYLASFGFAFLVVLIAKKLMDVITRENYKIYAIIVFTILLGGFYYFQNRVETAEWKEAGRITNRTLAYLRLYYDGKHPNSNFYFVNPPIRKAEAWIFPVGLDDGVWFIYRDNTIRVYKLTSVEEAKQVLKNVKDKGKNFVFAFDKNGNIYEIK